MTDPRHISEVLAELAEDLPDDVRETIEEAVSEDDGLPLGWEGVEVVT